MSTPANLAMIDGGAVPPTSDPATSGISLENVNLNPADEESRAKEEAVVRAFWKAYNEARAYDKPARKKFAIDRRYASGKANEGWAVTTNLIASMIDILTATLYARDPDVSITKSPWVEEANTRDMELFAQTLQIVVSRLWKSARLKRRMRRVIRAILSVGQGWLKVLMVGQKKPDPQIQGEINSLEKNLAKIRQLQANLLTGDDDAGSPMSSDQLAVAESDLQQQMDELGKKLEVMVYEGLAIDVVKADDIQVGTDVPVVEEYLDSDALRHTIYVKKTDVKAKFPRLTAADIAAATEYFRDNSQNADAAAGTGVLDMPVGGSTGDDYNGVYSTTPRGDARSLPYFKIVEEWNRADGSIYTGIEGSPHWAEAPYKPPYASKRFYPFFYFAIYEVDDERMPQSLSGRLAKLQDEYSCTRSNFRVSRERSIPGALFNATMLSDVEIAKVKNAGREEFIPVRPTNQETPLTNLFAAKPVSTIDPRLYDTGPIIQDTERVAGVQEAQTAAITVQKTATESEIQQQGFSARTDSGRDNIEMTLTELAEYTVECAIQCLSVETVQRIAGPTAFWPQGMAVDDLFTMVEVTIDAGTTGKPKKKTDQAAWGTILPMVQQLQTEIAGIYTQTMGNPMLLAAAKPLIDAKKALLKRTMSIAGIDDDLEQYLPQPVQPLVPGALPMLPPGAVAPDGSDPNSGGGAGLPGPALPPGAGMDGAAPPPGPSGP